MRTGWTTRWGRGFRAGVCGSAVAVLAACGAEEGSGPPRVGEAMPALQVTTLQGDTVSTARYEGRPLVINLWATWCPPCRAEMPYLQELASEYEDRGLVMVGISVDDRRARDAVEAFLDESGVDYDILLDPRMSSMDRLGVLGLPATYLVGPDGTLSHIRRGPIEEGDAAFLAALEAILPPEPAQ